MPYKCCVSNCSFENLKLHMFPKDVELCRKWCVAIAREELLAKLPIVQKYYRVCDVHFDEQSKFPDNRNRTNLKVGSVPRLHVPDVEMASSEIAVVPGKYDINTFDISVLDVEMASSEVADVPSYLQVELNNPNAVSK
ncbi:hypothetical protein MTP99_006936 [Tenebrio molitor]|nr:hypothetical protein MTP99_006936 [Tenebrio molitor]